MEAFQKSMNQIQELNSPAFWVAQAVLDISDDPKCKKYKDNLNMLNRAKTFDPWVMHGITSIQVDAIAAGCAKRPSNAARGMR